MQRDALSDPAPHNRNRVGYWLGFVFHPFTVFIPALLLLMKDNTVGEVVGWVVFIAVVILVPTLSLIQLARRRGWQTYHRGTRNPLYLVFWISMAGCVALAVLLDAPPRLTFALVTLCVWGPLQYVVNARLIKISAHVGVVCGIVTSFVVLGDLDSVLLVSGGIGIVLVTAWARIVTGHHSLVQVSLGIVVSVVAVLLTAGLMAWIPG